MFHKTADETNALLDMWVRVLSQAEHTQALLHDPEWEGKSWVKIFLFHEDNMILCKLDPKKKKSTVRPIDIILIYKLAGRCAD